MNSIKSIVKVQGIPEIEGVEYTRGEDGVGKFVEYHFEDPQMAEACLEDLPFVQVGGKPFYKIYLTPELRSSLNREVG